MTGRTIRTEFLTSMMCVALAAMTVLACKKTALAPRLLKQGIPHFDTAKTLEKMLDKLPNYHLFEAAIKHSQYDSLLRQGSNYYTLLAANDSVMTSAGFTEFSISRLDINYLDSILSNQIFPGNVTDSLLRLTNAFVRLPTVVYRPPFTAYTLPTNHDSPHYYSLDIEPGSLWVNGVEVGTQGIGIAASNGFIHLVNRLNVPPLQTVWAILTASPEFSFFVAAVRINDSIDGPNGPIAAIANQQLSPPGTQAIDSLGFLSNYFIQFLLGYDFVTLSPSNTFFIPTNEAFKKAGFNTIDSIRRYGSRYVTEYSRDLIRDSVPYSYLDTLILTHILDVANIVPLNSGLTDGYPTLGFFYLDFKKRTTFLNTYENLSGFYHQVIMPNNRYYPEVGFLHYAYDGRHVTVSTDSKRNLTPATIVEPDIVGTNGVIQGIDHLLWPY